MFIMRDLFESLKFHNMHVHNSGNIQNEAKSVLGLFWLRLQSSHLSPRKNTMVEATGRRKAAHVIVGKRQREKQGARKS